MESKLVRDFLLTIAIGVSLAGCSAQQTNKTSLRENQSPISNVSRTAVQHTSSKRSQNLPFYLERENRANIKLSEMGWAYQEHFAKINVECLWVYGKTDGVPQRDGNSYTECLIAHGFYSKIKN
jgi:hypothetical protein